MLKSRSHNEINRRISVLVVACAFATPLMAKDDPRCVVPQGDTIVQIDANTGALFGKSEFPQDTQVKLVLYNKNPFKYDYQWQVVSKNLEQTIINDALRLFLGRLPTDEETAPAPTPPPPQGIAAAAVSCLDMPGALSLACKMIEEAENQKGALDQGLKGAKKQLADAKKTYDDFVKLVAKDITTTSECNIVVGKTQTIGSVLELLLKLDGLPAFEKQVGEQQKNLTTALGILNAVDCDGFVSEEARNICKEETSTKPISLRSRAEGAKTDLDQLSREITTEKGKYTQDKDSFTKLGRRVLEILDSPQAFVETHPLPSRSAPTLHSITLITTRRSTGAKTALEVGDITVGRSHFSISAGFGFSLIEESTFGRQSGLDDNGMVKPVFAITDTSDVKIGGVVQLNALLAGNEDWGFHWSLGTGVGIGDGDAELSFFTGPSFSLIDHQLFFTLAYHQRTVKALSDDFKVGNVIPDGLEDSLPTTTLDDEGLLVTITYKIR